MLGLSGVRRTESSSVSDPVTDSNHAPIGQARNDGYSANSQKIPVLMENNCPEGTKGQSITYPSGEALGRDIHMRNSKWNRKPY